MFSGRKMVIATMHGKEDVIAPILEKTLGVNCVVPAHFNTDELGTFTGEIERMEDPVATARKKCLLALEVENCDLAIASEGSFGAHPSLLFLPCDDEFLLLIDKKNNLEIVARELSTETNFNGSIIQNLQEFHHFARSIGFPSHHLIVRRNKEDKTAIHKGIRTWSQLDEIFAEYSLRFGPFYAETDMRAMANPSRMKVIEQATLKLVEKIHSFCPNCSAPGFSVTKAISGLPCEACNLPTRSTLSHLHCCQKCGYQSEEKFPNHKIIEDPMYCDFCNP
jgi:hypothetical protein